MITTRYRVWVIINPPSSPEFRSVDSPEEGARLIYRVAIQQLQDDRIWGNAFGLEEYRGSEWSEWENDEYEDVRELSDHMEGKGELT